MPFIIYVYARDSKIDYEHLYVRTQRYESDLTRLYVHAHRNQ